MGQMNSERKEKLKYLKEGENVVHLEYFKEMISENEIENFEKKLNSVNLEFSRFDRTGELTAGYEQFDTYIYFLYPIFKQFAINAGSNAAWDIVKFIILSVWKKIHNKSIKKISEVKIENKQIKFGLRVKSGLKNYYLSLPNDTSEESTLIILDKSLDFLKKEVEKKDKSSMSL
jgi:hypothetical protein